MTNNAIRTKILSVMKEGEKLTGEDIVNRLRKAGYDCDPHFVKMFIFYRMNHQSLKREIEGKKTMYSML